jgi:hypothetical protein
LYEAGAEKLGTSAQIDTNQDQLKDIKLKDKTVNPKKRCHEINAALELALRDYWKHHLRTMK